MQFHGKGLFLILSACAIPLYAVDGVVLINQNTALAGNVTPGDTPGFPVTISMPGSYKLSGNLTVPDGDTTAIQITADDVTIDLNGFSIIGPNVCLGSPVTSCTASGFGDGVFSGAANTKVHNGNVRGMGGNGIHLSTDSQVENVHSTNNRLLGIGGGVVISSFASQNGLGGISAISVTGSAANGNGGGGILVGPVGLAINNTAKANGDLGIVASCPSTVIGNTAFGNQGGDIFIPGSGCTRANNAPAP